MYAVVVGLSGMKFWNFFTFLSFRTADVLNQCFKPYATAHLFFQGTPPT